MAMTLRDEYKREVFASWFDLRQVLADRRKLIFMPENTFEDDETELANSPFKFAVKSVVLPAAVLGFLATVPSTVMEMPPTPAERRIASLQAQADSTEESSRESLSNLDSATIQRAERSEVDSLRARHRARLESLASIAPDSAELRVSIEAVLTRLDSLRNRYQRQVEPLLDQMDSVRAHVEESSLARDSVRTILSEYMDIRAEFGRNTSREYAKAESLNSEYERLAAIQSLQVQQLDSISDYQTYQMADVLEETAEAQRTVALVRLANLKIDRLLEQLNLPITAGLVVINAFLFGWWLRGHYEVSVREGARLHMYFSSALLFLPTIAVGLFGVVAGVVVRFPESVLNAGLLPVRMLLAGWVVYATYAAAKRIALVVGKKNGENGGGYPRIKIAGGLLVTGVATSAVGAILINLLTYPVSQLIVSLNS